MANTEVKELIGVYNVDGGFKGELAYLAGRFKQSIHCELCDITHSPVRRKKDWDRFVADLPVPFTLLHRNELDDVDPRVAHLAHKAPPCVIAVTEGAPVIVLKPTDLAKAKSDVTIFEGILRNELVVQGLEMPR